ncbi:MAG: YedE-related selenium metabolism membrane protein, partial [Candidatus Firestonebacteria bacterium]|nr:YedE-related selenium metabolism membrane protein [Candidatus Firestonebacteria bacterium]
IDKILIISTGLFIGVFGVLLFVWGNPKNSGICISCFFENIAGALGLHNNLRMQYLRPEVMGFTLGSFILAFFTKEFKARGSEIPLISFMLGIIMLLGSAVFVGCPIKLMTKIGVGELSAINGIIGLIIGIWIGIQFLRDGFTQGEMHETHALNGLLIPGLMFILLIIFFIKPFFVYFSTEGPGSLHAPVWISLGISLIIGFMAQRSRFCVTGSIRNFILAGNTDLLLGLIFLLTGTFITGILSNNFEIIPWHKEFLYEYLWEFLAMLLVGWASVFAGGCPFRQLILAGEGNVDAGICVLGMLAGGAIVQNLSIQTTETGISFYGQIAVISGLMFLIITGLSQREKIE